MNWETYFKAGDRQDVLFLAVRDRFPEMSDGEFRAKVMAPIAFGVFSLSMETFLAALPEALRTEALRAFMDSPSPG